MLQYFWPALSDNWCWKPIFGLFQSGRFTQILYYIYECFAEEFAVHVLTWRLRKWAKVQTKEHRSSQVWIKLREYVDFLFIVTPIVGVCNWSMFCCTLLYVHSSIAIILMGKRELVALLNLSSWFLVMVEWLYFAVPWGCLRFVIVVFPVHTHFFFNNEHWRLYEKHRFHVSERAVLKIMERA